MNCLLPKCISGSRTTNSPAFAITYFCNYCLNYLNFNRPIMNFHFPDLILFLMNLYFSFIHVISILSVCSVQLPGMLRTSHSRACIHSIQSRNLLVLYEIGKMGMTEIQKMGTTKIRKMRTTAIYKMRMTRIHKMRTIIFPIDAEFVT